jgi:hypothetical protein
MANGLKYLTFRWRLFLLATRMVLVIIGLKSISFRQRHMARFSVLLIRIFNPRTQQEEDVTRTRVAIFGSYKENIYLAPEYIAGLTQQKDENRRRSWLDGDWNIVAGGALDGVWDQKVHVIPRFRIPKGWKVYLDRTFDWGSSKPFSVGFWAEAGGEEVVLPDGRTFRPQPGSLIQFAEIYGTAKIGTNKGVRWSAGDIAKAIKEMEKQLLSDQWIPYQPWPGAADNQISDVRESDVDTIELKMAKEGIRWTTSEKSKGSRRIGLQLLRDRLENATRKEGEGLYFMDNCRASIMTIPVLPTDPKFEDDVDSDAEDHAYDMVRYRVLQGSNRVAREVKVRWTN